MQQDSQSSKCGHQVQTYKFKKYNPNTCLEKFSYMIIRPPRFIYNEAILNPNKNFRDKYQHQVHFIPFPLSLYKTANMRYVLLYLHGNSSSRFEGFCHLNNLPDGVGLACFDFDGCGLRNEKEYISVGKSESIEVDMAFSFLKLKGFKVAAWGRSMGSVSLLLSSECDVMIADSPFSSLKILCKEVSQTQVPCACLCCFHCLFPCFFCLIARDVQQKTDMHPQDLQILQHVSRMHSSRSLMLIAAEKDSMINYHHAQKIHEKFSGKNKKIIVCQGDHNSPRPAMVNFECFSFIEKALFPSNPSELQDLKLKMNSKKSLLFGKKLRPIRSNQLYEEMDKFSSSEALQKDSQRKIENQQELRNMPIINQDLGYLIIDQSVENTEIKREVAEIRLDQMDVPNFLK